MKKVFSVLLMLICMTLFVTGQEIEKGVSALHQDAVSATSTVYKDGIAAVSTVYKDAKDATIALYPDAKGVIQTLYADGNRMISYLVPKVEAVITSLATGLKTTSAEVWRILVYKQVAMATTYLIYVIVILLLITGYCIGLNKVLKATKAQGGVWNDGHIAFTVFGAIISVLGLIVAGHYLPYIINGFMIPEAGALNEAVELTKQVLQSFK